MNNKIVRYGMEIDLSKEGHTGCPRCISKGKDRSHNNLMCYGLDEDGEHLGAYCFSCEYTVPSVKLLRENGDDFEDEWEDLVGAEFNEDVHNKLKEQAGLDPKGYRGIRKDISQRMGVRYSFDGSEENNVTDVYYPTTINYECSGYKHRIHPKDFSQPLGVTGKECELFGQFRFKTQNGTILIVGGEQDQLAAHQMLSDHQKNKNFDPVAVVSPTIGESGAWKQIQAQYEFFDQFKKIIICMDSDTAGQTAMERIYEVLPKGKVFVMKMRLKDPNEYIWNKEHNKLVHRESEFISDYFAAKPYTPKGVKSAADGLDEIREELLKPRITLPPYMHKMQEMMGGGMIQGRIANIIADTSTGKCLGKGTLVIDYNGNKVKVQDVKVGDLLMGADGTPRKVLSTTSGVAEMFKVSQVRGIDYTVNADHVLSLRARHDLKNSGISKGDVVNIAVRDWFNLATEEKKSLKGYKANFVEQGESTTIDAAISVESVGEGEYYGFELDGDHLFCLEDFTVTHNSTHVNRMVYHWIFNSPVTPTVVSLEATAAQYMLEMLSVHLQVNLLWKMKPEELLAWMETPEGKKAYNELAYREDGQPRFFILDERAGNIKDLEKELEMLFRKHNSRLFVVDVLTDLLRGSSESHSEDHMNFQRNMAKNGVSIVNVLHTRKPPMSPDGVPRKVTEYDALGTGSFVQSAAYNVVFNRDKLSEDAIERNTTEVDLPKCRGGKTGTAGKWYYEFDKVKVHDYDDYFSGKKAEEKGENH